MNFRVDCDEDITIFSALGTACAASRDTEGTVFCATRRFGAALLNVNVEFALFT